MPEKKRIARASGENLQPCPWCHKLKPFPGEWRNGSKEKGRVIYVCGDCAEKGQDKHAEEA